MKERSRTAWGLGDYAPTGRQLGPVSTALVDALGIGADHRVLDVAAGTGNCALAAARRGATVTAPDFSPVMIERGRARTDAEGLEVTWQESDAADLPFEDGRSIWSRPSSAPSSRPNRSSPHASSSASPHRAASWA